MIGKSDSKVAKRIRLAEGDWKQCRVEGESHDEYNYIETGLF